MNFVISNKFDFFFIKFPIILPIVYLFFLSAFPLYEDYLILLTLLLLAEPHFGATWPFLIDKHNSYIKKDNQLSLIVFPILIFIFCLIGFFYFSKIFFLIFYLANFFHVTRQSAGVSKLYLSDSKQKLFQEYCIYFYGSILFLIGFFRFYLPIITNDLLIYINFLMVFFLFLLIAIHLSLFGSKEIFVFITGLIIFYPMCFVQNPIHAIIMGVTMHYSQYLCLTYKIKTRRNDSNQLNIKKYFLLFIFMYGLIMASISSLGNNNTLIKNLIIIPIIGQMIHFYLDSFLWKFSNKKVREATIPFIFNKN